MLFCTVSCRAAARELDGGRSLAAVRLFRMAVLDLFRDALERLEDGGAQGVIRCINDYVRPRSYEVEGRLEGRTVGEAPLQMDARLVDLEIGQDRFQLGFDHIDDRNRGSMVAVAEGHFHGWRI